MTYTYKQIAAAANVLIIEAEIDAFGSSFLFDGAVNLRLIERQTALKAAYDALLVACGHDLTANGGPGVALAHAVKRSIAA